MRGQPSSRKFQRSVSGLLDCTDSHNTGAGTRGNYSFGAKYLDLRGYTQGQAVYDGQSFGLIDAGATPADYEMLFWGSDPVHHNKICSYIWAAKMWNRLLELGFVESGDLFAA